MTQWDKDLKKLRSKQVLSSKAFKAIMNRFGFEEEVGGSGTSHVRYRHKNGDNIPFVKGTKTNVYQNLAAKTIESAITPNKPTLSDNQNKQNNTPSNDNSARDAKDYHNTYNGFIITRNSEGLFEAFHQDYSFLKFNDGASEEDIKVAIYSIKDQVDNLSVSLKANMNSRTLDWYVHNEKLYFVDFADEDFKNTITLSRKPAHQIIDDCLDFFENLEKYLVTGKEFFDNLKNIGKIKELG